MLAHEALGDGSLRVVDEAHLVGHDHWLVVLHRDAHGVDNMHDGLLTHNLLGSHMLLLLLMMLLLLLLLEGERLHRRLLW